MKRPSLTEADLLDALRQRHFYASDDWNAEATFTVNNQLMGSVFTGPGAAAIQLSASDPDNEAAGTTLTLMRGVPGSGTRATALTTTAPGTTTLSVSDPLPSTSRPTSFLAISKHTFNQVVFLGAWHLASKPVPLARLPARATLSDNVARW